VLADIISSRFVSALPESFPSDRAAWSTHGLLAANLTFVGGFVPGLRCMPGVVGLSAGSRRVAARTNGSLAGRNPAVLAPSDPEIGFEPHSCPSVRVAGNAVGGGGRPCQLAGDMLRLKSKGKVH
jgi:hypothetical protein